MTLLCLALFGLLSLAAGQSNVNQRDVGGMQSDFEPKRQGAVSVPFARTTTVTTVLDLSTGISKNYHSSRNHGGSEKFDCGGENRMMEGASFFNVLSDNDINMLNSTWNVLRTSSDFAPKVFMRYFIAKPEAQKLFRVFANVPLTDLPNNLDFLNAAYSCIASLDYILPHIKYAHPERCPALIGLKDKYSTIDLKKFGPIWMKAMQEEMGNALTNEVRDVWKKAIGAFSDYASH